MAATSQNTEKLDFEKVWLMFKETDKKFQDTDKKFQDTERIMKETDRKFQETDKKLNKLEYLFTTQWGKLIESLVDGDLVNLLNQRGIKVITTTLRSKTLYNGRQYEFDIIVEVKTTLRQDDIKEFLEELNDINNILPKYKDYKIYGAIAFLTEDTGCSTFASKNGLFTIKATGNSASITNSKTFKPKAY